MRDREITNAHVLTAFKNVVAAERECMRKELQRCKSAFDDKFQQWQAEVTELRAELAEAKPSLRASRRLTVPNAPSAMSADH